MAIVIASEFDIVRLHLTQLIREKRTGDTLIEAAGYEELMDAVDEHRPQIVVFDSTSLRDSSRCILESLRKSIFTGRIITLHDSQFAQYDALFEAAGVDFSFDIAGDWSVLIDRIDEYASNRM